MDRGRRAGGPLRDWTPVYFVDTAYTAPPSGGSRNAASRGDHIGTAKSYSPNRRFIVKSTNYATKNLVPVKHRMPAQSGRAWRCPRAIR